MVMFDPFDVVEYMVSASTLSRRRTLPRTSTGSSARTGVQISPVASRSMNFFGDPAYDKWKVLRVTKEGKTVELLEDVFFEISVFVM